jgi:Domain of unknown function (DUF4832)/Domain of unknown function (DUF4874)
MRHHSSVVQGLRLCAAFAAVVAMASCGGSSSTSPASPAPAASAPAAAPSSKSVQFEASDAAFPNPERGFHAGASLVRDIWGRTSDYAFVREQGLSVVRGYVRMDNFRDRDFSDQFLQDLRTSLSDIRAAGIKTFIVFSYNFPETVDPGGALDAPVEQVERHLAQLAPVFAEYEDVLMGLHTGFVGAWGEWHSSSNQLDSPENKARVLRAILAALPKSRWMQLRYPGDHLAIYPTPLSQASAFNASDQARVGFANMCFLANEHDAGTWLDQADSTGQAKRSYMQAATKYMAVGGETCQVQPDAMKQPAGCDKALSELALYHWSFLNKDFYEPTLTRWKNEGCYDTIARRLGYRLALQSAQVQEAVRPGGELRLSFALRNSGFAAPSNARGLQVVLRRQSDGQLLRVNWADRADPRRWFAGDANHDVTVAAGIPANAPAGVYDVLLNLNDTAPSLAARPEYSIRLASTQQGRDVWEAATGYNQVFATVRIDPSAAGDAFTGDRWFE